MNPSLSARMVVDRRRDLEALTGTGRSLRRRRRHSVVRALGLGLIRAGQRLVGPDEIRDQPGLRPVSTRPSL